MNIMQQACKQVMGFEPFYQKFIRRMTINDRAESTCKNYGRSLANLAFHFNAVPTALTLEQIEEYLYFVKEKTETGSDNSFKFTIAALRFVFRMEGLDEIRLQLPAIRKKRKLPVVLSKQQLSAMMNIPYSLHFYMDAACVAGKCVM
jgi:site-specific recombinase XerD